MGLERLKSQVGVCKVGILVLGIVVLGVGIHSHFQSSWKKANLYKICYLQEIQIDNCPSIYLENYYVAMIITCFTISLVSFVGTLCADVTAKSYKYVDAGFHGVSGFLLSVAAMAYLQSTKQISYLFGGYSFLELYQSEKIAAGFLTLFLAFLYAITAMIICKVHRWGQQNRSLPFRTLVEEKGSVNAFGNAPPNHVIPNQFDPLPTISENVRET